MSDRLTPGQRLWIAYEDGRRLPRPRPVTVGTVSRKWAAISHGRVTVEQGPKRGCHLVDRGVYGFSEALTDAQFVASQQRVAMADARRKAATLLTGDTVPPETIATICALLGIEAPAVPTAAEVLAAHGVVTEEAEWAAVVAAR